MRDSIDIPKEMYRKGVSAPAIGLWSYIAYKLERDPDHPFCVRDISRSTSVSHRRVGEYLKELKLGGWIKRRRLECCKITYDISRTGGEDEYTCKRSELMEPAGKVSPAVRKLGVTI